MFPHELQAELTVPQASETMLRPLLKDLAGEEHHQLLERLATVEREQRCLRRAVFLTTLLLLLSLAGVGYCAILWPEEFRDRSPLLVHSLWVLALGSLISQLLYVGYLLWHRAEAFRLREAGWFLIVAMPRPEPGTSPPSASAVQFRAGPSLDHHENDPSVPGSEHSQLLVRPAGAAS